MAQSGKAKAMFAAVVVVLLVSLGALSYIYISGGQEAYSGDDGQDDGGDDVSDNGDTDTQALAPDFTYADINGGVVSLSGLRGNVVVLDFMATWCGPCESQIQNLVQIKNEYVGQGVTFVSIDVDTSESASELLAFKNELGATWQFALDMDGMGSNPAYMATSIPTMVFIDREGHIAYRDVGLMSVTELRNTIDPLL